MAAVHAEDAAASSSAAGASPASEAVVPAEHVGGRQSEASSAQLRADTERMGRDDPLQAAGLAGSDGTKLSVMIAIAKVAASLRMDLRRFAVDEVEWQKVNPNSLPIRKERTEDLLKKLAFANRLMRSARALLVWSSKDENIQLVRRSIALLEHSNQQRLATSTSAAALRILAAECESSFDCNIACGIHTTADLLSRGTYSRLPLEPYIGFNPALLPPGEWALCDQAETVTRLNRAIRGRVVGCPGASLFSSLAVEQGRLVCSQKDEFQLELTLSGDDSLDKWKLLHVDIFVAPERIASEERQKPPLGELMQLVRNITVRKGSMDINSVLSAVRQARPNWLVDIPLILDVNSRFHLFGKVHEVLEEEQKGLTSEVDARSISSRALRAAHEVAHTFCAEKALGVLLEQAKELIAGPWHQLLVARLEENGRALYFNVWRITERVMQQQQQQHGNSSTATSGASAWETGFIVKLRHSEHLPVSMRTLVVAPFENDVFGMSLTSPDVLQLKCSSLCMENLLHRSLQRLATGKLLQLQAALFESSPPGFLPTDIRSGSGSISLRVTSSTEIVFAVELRTGMFVLTTARSSQWEGAGEPSVHSLVTPEILGRSAELLNSGLDLTLAIGSIYRRIRAQVLRGYIVEAAAAVGWTPPISFQVRHEKPSAADATSPHQRLDAVISANFQAVQRDDPEARSSAEKEERVSILEITVGSFDAGDSLALVKAIWPPAVAILEVSKFDGPTFLRTPAQVLSRTDITWPDDGTGLKRKETSSRKRKRSSEDTGGQRWLSREASTLNLRVAISQLKDTESRIEQLGLSIQKKATF
eukprot:g3503.t1